MKNLNLNELESINGGFGWGDALLGLLGGFAKSPTLEQLNGGATKNFKPRSC
ncbi:ComC/BlpC family peptide pheromone/bacteriocin [Clostridium perfringens]|nr:ComC/BlpC family peptide pheromone/bacteriocin [Clostridium perfringens]